MADLEVVPRVDHVEVVEHEQHAHTDDEEAHQQLRGERPGALRPGFHDQLSPIRSHRRRPGSSMARQIMPIPAPTISSGHDVP